MKNMGFENAAPLNLDGLLDVAHRFCMALVAAQARNSGELEKVIPYAPGRSVRTDVYVETRDGVRLIEIEQELSSNNRDRAVEKLKGYAELFATDASDLIPELLIIFNLPASNLKRTLNIWQLALRDAGDMSFPVYYSTLEGFMFAPEFVNWGKGNFSILTPSEKKRRIAETPVIPGEIPGKHPVRTVSMIDMDTVASVITSRIHVAPNEEDTDRLYHLGHIAYLIHQLDFNQETGRTRNYAAFPANSLRALSDFLHHPMQRPLIEILKPDIQDFQKRIGITQQRLAASRLAWNFLEYFGFGSTSPLSLQIGIPEMGDSNVNEVSFKLLLTGQHKLEKLEKIIEYLAAISWVMTVLLIYPDRLGLVDEVKRRGGK